MPWVNFARGEVETLDSQVTDLYFLAIDLEPDPDQPPPWEGGPRIVWHFICLVDQEADRLIPIAFTEMSKVMWFTKARQGHQYLPPSNEIIRVSIATLREGRCQHDILVDPDPDDLGEMLASGRYVWHEEGIATLV